MGYPHLLVECTKKVIYLNPARYQQPTPPTPGQKERKQHAPKEWKTRRACSVRAGCPETITHPPCVTTPHLRQFGGYETHRRHHRRVVHSADRTIDHWRGVDSKTRRAECGAWKQEARVNYGLPTGRFSQPPWLGAPQKVSL